MKYIARYLRAFETTIEAADIKAAEVLARAVEAQFPDGSVKLLRLQAEDYVEPPADPETPPRPPFGRPNGGGSPGTPVVKQEILVDQIAKVA